MTDASKKIERLVRTAHEQGWMVTKTKSGHWRFKPPDGGPIFMSGTPSDGKRSLRNAVARLRKAGLQI